MHTTPRRRDSQFSILNFCFVLALLLMIMVALPRPAAAEGGLSVESTSPAPRSIGALRDDAIRVTFDQPVNRATITARSFWAFGRWSGVVAGTISYADSDRTVILTPSTPLSAGEQVMVTLAKTITGAGGVPMAQGYSFQYWVTVTPNTTQYSQVQTLEVRSTPQQSTRAYGGVATDFNNDGWLDISIVNEDTADVRTFLNRADGTATFDDFLEPTTPVNDRASPSEPTDFNFDGDADLVVVNIDANTVSVLLGNGDGTFQPQQEISVGSVPRGVAVLDVEGDGDMDIVNANAGSGNLSLLLNDGNGNFGSPSYFENGGATNEWGLVAADMNGDGLLDLVVGTQSGSPTIRILQSAGNGTFTLTDSSPSGGPVWMLNTGDVNRDGHEDVVSVNSNDDNGSILLGDGAGAVGQPTIMPTDPFPLATDLGDVDGDGDLDWLASSFFGDWQLFRNDGNGGFTSQTVFTASNAASCALMMDADNDGDLDLALIDELADEVLIMQNQFEPPTATAFSGLQTLPSLAWMGGIGAIAGLAAVGLAVVAWRRVRDKEINT